MISGITRIVGIQTIFLRLAEHAFTHYLSDALQPTNPLLEKHVSGGYNLTFKKISLYQGHCIPFPLNNLTNKHIFTIFSLIPSCLVTHLSFEL